MNLVLSILMLAAIAMIFGAYLIWRRTGDRKKAALMLLLAVIAMANVAIWTVPDAGGNAPLDQIRQQSADSIGQDPSD